MRRLALLGLALLAAGCASAPAPAAAGAMRLLIAGTVDLSGTAAIVAGADPEGLLREVRLLARSADLAIVAAAPAEAWGLLAAAGFDLVACPRPRSLAAAGAGGEVGLRCAGKTGLGWAGSLHGPSLVAWNGGLLYPPSADIRVSVPGSPAATAVSHTAFGRMRLTVSGLGTLLSADASAAGILVEVLADADGVIAYRLGRVTHGDFRVHFAGWDLPPGNAVLLDGEWWALVRPTAPEPVLPPPETFAFAYGDLVAAATGDVTGDGSPDLAVSYRHPFRPSALSETYDGAVGVDATGRSAHLGVFTLDGEALWAAGYIPRPVGDLAACDGALALAYTALDDPTVVATGAAVWQRLSLRPAPELPGRGIPGCADVDGDGRLDPVILGRVG